MANASEDKSWATLVVVVITAVVGVGGTLQFTGSGNSRTNASAAFQSSATVGGSRRQADEDLKSAFACARDHLNLFRPSQKPDSDWQLDVQVRNGGGQNGSAPERAKARPPDSNLNEQRAEWEKRRDALHQEVVALVRRYDDFPPAPEIEFLIATMPDPVQSHLQALLDWSLPAIQVAAQQFDYFLERFELPWAPGDATTGDSWPTARFHRRPGVLLFRKEPGKRNADANAKQVPGGTGEIYDRHFLVVFLVGEGPTSGIHKSALVDALEQIAAWTEYQQPGNYVEFCARIVGPTFSGSADTLRVCIDEWWERCGQARFCGGGRVQFITGTATANRNAEVLNWESGLLKADFRSTTHTDCYIKSRMLEYLRQEKGLLPPQIALLSEYGTSYAARMSEPWERKEKIKECREADAQETARRQESFLQLNFPPEIGRLRTAYDAQPDLKYGPAPTQQHRSGLEIPFSASPSARDAFPKFDRAAAAWAERQLNEIFNALSRQAVRAVGVIGTDPLDVMFLIQQIHLHAPDKVLFTFDNHLLYTHDDYRVATNGLLIATTYPLFIENQEWFGTDAPGVLTGGQFKSGDQEGVYNAAIAHFQEMFPHKVLEQRHLLVDYPRPPAMGGQTSKCKENDCKPPLWLVTVSNGSLWPVKIWEPDPSPYAYQQPRTAREGRGSANAKVSLKLPRPKLRFVLCSMGVSIAILVALHRRIRRYAAARLPRIRKAERTAWLLLIGSVLPIHVLVCLPLWLFCFGAGQVDGITGNLFIGAVNLASVVILFFLVGYMTVFPTLVRQSEPGSRPIRASSLLGYCVASALTLCLLLAGIAYYQPLERGIFLQRVGHPESGVSPLMPAVLLLGTVALMAWCQVRGVAFCYKSPIAQPKHVADGPLQASLQLATAFDYIAQHRRRIKNLWPRHAHADTKVIAAIILVAASYFVCAHWIAPAETRAFQYLLNAVALAAIMAVLFLLVQLIEMCRGFRRVLGELAKHPIVDAFSDLPRSQYVRTTSFVVPQYESGYDRPEMLHALGRLRRDRQLPPKVRGIYEANVEQSSARVFNTAMAKAATELSASLLDYWEFKEVQEAPRPERDHPKGEQPHNGGRAGHAESPVDYHQRAERFIALFLANIIRKMAAHVQRLMLFLVIAFLVLLWALNCYPFQPKSILNLAYFVLALALAGYMATQLVKFNRDEILSRLNKTTPNQLTFDASFVVTMIAYVVIPLLGLAVTQVPELAEFVSNLTSSFGRASAG